MSSDGHEGWEPLPFRATTHVPRSALGELRHHPRCEHPEACSIEGHVHFVPLPALARHHRTRHPGTLAMGLLEAVHRDGGFVSPAAFGLVAEAVRLCDAGNLEGGLDAANRAAVDEPAIRPLALLVARMCVHKQLEAERTTAKP